MTATLTAIEDGAGNDSDLLISTNKARVSTAFGIGVDPSVGKLHINAATGQAVTIDNGNASLIIGKGTQYSFCIGDCNPVGTVGGGTSSTAAQANENYISSNTAANSGAGEVLLMNGASAGTGAIGIGQDTVSNGFIHFGDADKKFKFEGRNTTQSFDVHANSETLLSIDGSNKRIGLGENTTAPTATVEIAETGVSKSTTDVLSILNRYWNADMNLTSSRISFKNQYSATPGEHDDAAWINAGAETDWTGTASTRDGFMGFYTSQEGHPTEAVRIDSNGYVGIGTSNPTSPLYVTGDAYVTGTLTAGSISEISKYKLEEYFTQKPGINADMASETESTRMIANKNFEIQGTNSSSTLCTFDTTRTGILLTTDTTSGDEMIIMPHTDTNQSAWGNVTWGAADEIIWECAVTTHATEANAKNNVRYHLGLFTGTSLLDQAHTVTTLTDQAFFYYDSSDTTFPNQADNTKWHFVYSNNGTDFVTKIPFTLQHGTTYKFKITIDSSYKPRIFINDAQFGLTTVGVAGATGNTGVAINNVGGYGTSGSPVAMIVDTVDATTKIVVGDTLTDSGGTIIGTVTAVAATLVTVSTITHAVADSEVLFIFGNTAASSTTEGSALLSSAHYVPQIGVATRTSAAKTLTVHYQKITRNLT